MGILRRAFRNLAHGSVERRPGHAERLANLLYGPPRRAGRSPFSSSSRPYHPSISRRRPPTRPRALADAIPAIVFLHPCSPQRCGARTGRKPPGCETTNSRWPCQCFRAGSVSRSLVALEAASSRSVVWGSTPAGTAKRPIQNACSEHLHNGEGNHGGDAIVRTDVCSYSDLVQL